ncbi:CU044_5270 family protein (plasmid) [Citricoccus nitrophenolicus]
MNTPRTMDPVRRDAMRDLLVQEARQSTTPTLTALPGRMDTAAENSGRAGTESARKLSPAPRRSAPRRWVLAGAAAAMVGALMIGSGVMSGPGGATPAAAAVLEDAALETIHAVDPVVREDQYLKVTTTTATAAETTLDEDPAPVFVQARSSSTTYVPGDESQEWVLEDGEPSFVNAYGLSTAQFEAATDGDFEEPEIRRAVNGEFYGPDQAGPDAVPTDDYLASLPRDPRQLLEVIRDHTRGQGTSPDGQVLVYVADLMRTHRVPADLRAALYRAVALVPGVDVAAAEASINGRQGVAIGHEETNGVRTDLIVDPDTGLLIGERSVATDGNADFPAGTILKEEATTATVVGSAP